MSRLFLFYTVVLPVDLLPSDLPSLNLPTFDSDLGRNSSQPAAATARGDAYNYWYDPLAQGVRSPQLLFTHSSTYSAASRLPQKLVEKILKLEFVDMSEMLPETWIPKSQDTEGVPRRTSRRVPIKDILVWTECFSLIAAILVEMYPSKAPQLWG